MESRLIQKSVRTAVILSVVSSLVLVIVAAAFHSLGPAAVRPMPHGFGDLSSKRLVQPLPFQKGVNFTAEWPDTYASAGALQMLEELPTFGINAVALVPYGFTPRNVPIVRFGFGWESDEGIERMASAAHYLGMSVFLKPQIWVRGGYPGNLSFEGQDLDRWFAAYQNFIEHQAQLASRIHADLFCVGVEFAKISGYKREWRNLIARIRQLYAGPLVYAANSGEEFETLAFWDDLDYIGLNDYYSLPDDLSMEVVVRKIEVVQQEFGKPVIFTEVGFSSSESPNRRPWDDTQRSLSLSDQARCYDAVFRAFYDKPWFQGVYWWKVGSNGYGGSEDGSHTPWGKPAMDVIARWYLKPNHASVEW